MGDYFASVEPGNSDDTAKGPTDIYCMPTPGSQGGKQPGRALVRIADSKPNTALLSPTSHKSAAAFARLSRVAV